MQGVSWRTQSWGTLGEGGVRAQELLPLCPLVRLPMKGALGSQGREQPQRTELMQRVGELCLR